MKSFLWSKLLLCGLVFSAGLGQSATVSASSPDEVLGRIHWFGQAAIRIDTHGKKIFIDPFRLTQKDRADLILVTHCHQDHFSPSDIAKIATETTKFVAPEPCATEIEKKFATKVLTIPPGEEAMVDSIHIRGVPAYNIIKTNFHPRANNWLGYLLDIDGVTVYHAGDTERVPEMKTFTADIAMLPLGQTYTMNLVEEAVQTALDVKAAIAVPIHYGVYEGKTSDAEIFKERLQGQIKVVILDQE